MESIGPVSIVAHNQGSNTIALAVSKLVDGSIVATDKDTAVADEDTAYDGDTSTLEFTGEALDNTPILPGSVTIKPTSGGDSVNATDRDGDGILYTDDDDEDACGTIDYFTGDLALDYPTGKAPNTGDIDADYTYQDEATVAGGKRTFNITSVVQGDHLVVKAACSAKGGSFVKVDGIASWV
jgi:hypothetical protein